MRNNKQYLLPKTTLKSLYQRAYRAQQKDHSEICGGLIADQSRHLELHYLKNKSSAPEHFEIEIIELRKLRIESETNNKKLVGTFHSHPIGYPVPSARDIREARINSLMLIYDVCGCTPKLWKIIKENGKKTFKEMELVIGTHLTLIRPARVKRQRTATGNKK